ncbi:Protein MAIN-LIKE 2 [Glycine soja]
MVIIMVRTKSSGRALGRVIGRALGRERRRPIASIRRQQEAALVVEDVHNMDHANDEVHEQPKEATADDVATDVEGFPGRPHDTSVLQDYVYHVAAKVWNGEEHPELKLSSYGRKVEKFGRPALEIEGLRWHKETSSFHLSVGDVTITLDDVALLLHLPITGTFHTFEPLHVDDVVLLLVELLERQELRYFLNTLYQWPGDPPRHPPVQHHDTFVELDVAQHLVAAMAMDEPPEDAHADVKQPRHAVVKYIFKCDCYLIYVNIH